MKDAQKQFQNEIVQQVLQLLGGKWRGAILASLCSEPKRFNEIKRDIGQITARALTKELKFLEMRKLLIRDIEATQPVRIKYRLTRHGYTLEPLIAQIVSWGLKHKKLNETRISP